MPIGSVIIPACGYIDYWLLRIQSDDGDFAGITILAATALWHWVTSPKRRYAKAYKKDILPSLARLFGDFTYRVNGKIDMKVMNPSKIIPYHQKCETEDYFQGTYKGINIEFCEMKLTKRSGSGKRRRTITVFKGLAVLLQLNYKKFYGHTILDKDQSKLGSWFKEKGSNLKKANLVDPEFERIFDVYTNDQVEARYLIDPKMIEDIKGLYLEYNGDKMAAAFYDTQMLILIASRYNHFEPADIYVRATSPESILSMKGEIERILSLVDQLSLYDPHAVHKNSDAAE